MLENRHPHAVLLVEDEKRLANLLRRRLEKENYLMHLAFDGESALELIRTTELVLVLIDINLPNKSGFEVLQELRNAVNQLPVIVISARDSVRDRLHAFELGADDYLVKPFEPAELLARMEAVLKRGGSLRMSMLKAGELTLDLTTRKVCREGKQIDLSARELSLLEFLMRNKNQILTRRRIAEQVWGYTFDTGTNIVDVYMSYLRKAIDRGYQRKLLHTIHGEGFILSGD